MLYLHNYFYSVTRLKLYTTFNVYYYNALSYIKDRIYILGIGNV